MNILILNTSDHVGGAAIAASRLMKALNKQSGIQCRMLTRKKKFPAFYFERFVIWMHNGFKRKGLFDVSIANCGEDVTNTKEFKDADIIHLHWINQGFLSLVGLRKILESGKPIIWTMHDMWAFTGVCHYANGCEKYWKGCCDCPQLMCQRHNDLSATYFEKKKTLFRNADIRFVGCSQWMADMARKSGLLAGNHITNIPNAIDTDVFIPLNKNEVRKKFNLPLDKKLILFCSMKTTDTRKGMSYLIDACQYLQDCEYSIIILGGKAEIYKDMLPMPIHCLNYVGNEKDMADVYNAADVFVTPSMQDNLPNTIMEAMSCGTPCVGFNTGGIPEMIDHKRNGYVAEYRNAQDLAKGITWVLENMDKECLCENARTKVMENYTEAVVAKRYIEMYNSSRLGAERLEVRG
ncbi:MAG: glycosyltransferase family 4 protein [Prevotella sp.]|nr:glycosyltransferase family 4 protein [Candidatus Equicola stercoris]